MDSNVAVMVAGPIGVGAGKIHAGEIAVDRDSELGQAIREHIVLVDSKDPSCCIDGRNCIHTMNGEATGARASTAGGALVTAFAAAELVGWFGDDTSSTPQRMGRINTLLRTAGIVPGNHVDLEAVDNRFIDVHTGKPRTGCGAADLFTKIIRRPFTSDDAINSAQNVKGITAVLLGEDYDESCMSFDARANDPDRLSDWLPTDVVDACGNATQSNVEILQSDESPTHGHNEIIVAVNYIENTTIDRDAFTAETGEQLFKIDMWYIDKLAKALATGPDSTKQYKQLKHAMVAYQAATYLELCDGSQRLVIVR